MQKIFCCKKSYIFACYKLQFNGSSFLNEIYFGQRTIAQYIAITAIYCSYAQADEDESQHLFMKDLRKMHEGQTKEKHN